MKYKVVVSNRETSQILKSLLLLECVGLDSETESTDWRRDRMIMSQLADYSKDIAYLFDMRKVDPQLFKPLLESTTVVKIIHNSPFDCSWLRREYGISVHSIYDTMHSEQQLLGLSLPRTLTKAQREILKPKWSAALEHCLGRRGWPNKFEFEPFTWEGKWTQSQIEYSVRDVEWLHKLREDQVKKLFAMDQENVVTLESKVAEVSYQLSTNGFGVDKKGWMAYAAENEVKYEALLAQLRKYDPDLNWQAPGQVCKRFGVRVLAELEALGLTSPDYIIWRELRDIYKNVTTYGKKWGQTHVLNNRVYCQYNQIKNTGRYSADSPNLQQIPIKSKHRSFFVPNFFKGGSFVIADFKGQELAIMAVGSGQQSWLDTLRSGGDVHSMCAEMVLKQGWTSANAEVKKQLRQDIKEINFGIPYGMTVPGYMEKTGHSEERARALFSEYKRTFPALIRWLADNGDFTVKHGVSYSLPPFNRYRNVAPIEPESWRKKNIGGNNPVQATGADMTKLSMVYMDKEKKDNAIFVLQLHDELVMECRPGKEEWTVSMMRTAMNKACAAILGEELSTPEIRIAKDWTKH